MFTDFKNSFTVGFCNKFGASTSLYFPPHLNLVITLPCETSADTFRFQQIADGIRGHVQVRKNSLVFVNKINTQLSFTINMVVEINGTYCRDVMPIEQLLMPVMREISGEFFICSKILILHTELAIQSDFWHRRHPLSFRHTCGPNRTVLN